MLADLLRFRIANPKPLAVIPVVVEVMLFQVVILMELDVD